LYEPSKEVCGHLGAKCLWCSCAVTIEDGHYKLDDGRYLHTNCRVLMESSIVEKVFDLMNIKDADVNTDFGEA